MDTFRVRLNYIDHYQSTPTDLDPTFAIEKGQVYKVPVIRVFGATETGQKVCAHVHGFLPYVYLGYQGSLEKNDIEVSIHRVRLSIDRALAVSYRRDKEGSKTAFVAHVSLVKGIPFYGYHVGYQPFFKVYLLNPLHITRLADLLRQGAVLGTSIQTFESHMQYVPQWMSDYNLYGCGYLESDNVKFRGPVPSVDEIDIERHKWHNISIPNSRVLEDWKYSRQSHCAIEIDICVQDILNRRAVKQRHLHHDFTEAIKAPEYQEKLVPSMESLWRDESRRRRLKMGLLDPDSSPFEPEVLVSVSAEARENSGDWIHEDEYRNHMRRLAADEMDKSGGSQVSFSDFELENSKLQHIKTAYESVEDLYPSSLQEALTSQEVAELAAFDGQGDEDIKVDEVKIRSFGEFSDIDELDVPSNGDALDARLRNTRDRVGNKVPKPFATLPKDEELASMGIRSAGDYSHADEDAFEVPDEYTSNITESLAHRQGQKRLQQRYFWPNKKRKHHNRPEQKDSLKQSSIDAPPRSSQESLSNRTTPTASQSEDKSLPFKHRKGNTLRFPIVKDPSNPLTIERLSQQSSNVHDGSPNKAHNRSHSDLRTNDDSKTSFSDLYSGSRSSTNRNSPPPSTQPRPRSEWTRHYYSGFGTNVLRLDAKPPTAAEVKSDLTGPGAISQIYPDAHYGDESDVPERKYQYGGKEFSLASYTAPFLPKFDPYNESLVLAADQPTRIPNRDTKKRAYKQLRQKCGLKSWEIDKLPPSREDVERWLQQDGENKSTGGKFARTRTIQKPSFTQVPANTQKHDGAKYFRDDQQSTSVQHEIQYMSVMSLEIHVNTRRTFVPNPQHDELAAVFWRLQDESIPAGPSRSSRVRAGIVVLSEEGKEAAQLSKMSGVEVLEEDSELDLLNTVIDVVRECDPDIITGFEVHDGSWGYLIERARLRYQMNLCDLFSRTKTDSHSRFGREEDRWGFNQTSTIRITGRHMINIWRAMKGELNLLQYTMENIMFHLFKRRVPHYSFSDLTRWWKSGRATSMARTVRYFLDRTQHDLDILAKNDFVPRISEQARLLGVDFFSVFSRGSQFKVESLMFRIAKPENFILVSPSRKQVGEQNALECLPLVMEPHSAFYNSPLVVLDFQSLYPSVMIAYNYCYSTFLGRIVDWRGQNKMGFTEYRRRAKLLELLKDYINISPNGMMYCTPKVRKSLLAKMLGEILETRVMVKSGMKKEKEDEMLQRLLNNRQLALKFIANVTYGYTSASFSGRMPCTEIADSIVQTGRETLEKAIMLIHSVEKWGAEVVYGDTDSLFVYLKGRSRDEAFTIGQEIADSITAVNPKPVKLKFEKVYHPCVLLAKKRYVGFKYEHRKQKEPEFDAKGIETVRRDGTPAEQRIEEKVLKLLFRTQDLSQVKRYFQEQCWKIMRGDVSIQDFCYAREVKLGTYSDKGPPPPGALISSRKMLEDPRAEPQYGERVPYVVVTGAPGARLIDRCVSPEELLRSPHLELDADYYISKNLIPPLQRIFNLVGANVRQWYDEMPKFQRIRAVPIGVGSGPSGSKSLMENYMRRTQCVICTAKLQGKYAKGSICGRCEGEKHVAALTVQNRLNRAETEVSDLEKLCRSCAGLRFDDEVACDSKACPVFYSRTRHGSKLEGTRALLNPVLKTLEEGLKW